MAEQKSNTSEVLTREERDQLAPYVTNTDGSVFALTNLPEVIKGALFSKYSRSPLGLRRILLKDFIQTRSAEFAGIVGTPHLDGNSLRPDLAIEKAQKFYDRILDGYGDDSIGELGGAHLAIENVSMIATKVIEDARIGGSPLEKSTRYVDFGDQVNGEFRFYLEPKIMSSRHANAYRDTCRQLFQSYSELYVDLFSFLRDHPANKMRPGTSKEDWQKALRAKTFDSVRGLLPAATLTNMGIFGNGRFFESLLIKCGLSELQELRAVGKAAQLELSKVIPSFIRRSNENHPHFEGYREHAELQRKVTNRFIPSLEEDSTDISVRLVDFDPEAEAKILAALFYSSARSSMGELRRWAGRIPEADRGEIFDALADTRKNRRHKPPRAFELAYYTFDLVGDFGMYRDLHRHRMLTQQRQRLSTKYSYEVPEDIAEAGLGDRYAAPLDHADKVYRQIAREFPDEAQYVVPMAYKIRWSVTINLRALIWLVELRSGSDGHIAYRRMARNLYHAVAEIHPRMASMFRFVNLDDQTTGRLRAEQRQRSKAHTRISQDQLIMELE